MARLIAHRRLTLTAVLVLIAVESPETLAVDRTWIGGNNSWFNGVGNNANWSGSDEPDTDDVAIFNTSNAVNLTSSNTVAGLTLSGGIDLNFNGFDLDVLGPISMIGPVGMDSTNLLVPTGSLVTATGVSVNGDGTSPAELSLQGGTIQLDGGVFVVGSTNTTQNPYNSVLSGFGSVDLAAAGVGTLRLRNDGAIVTNGLLTISSPGGGTVDLDGTTGNGVLDVHDGNNLTANLLTVSAPLSDSTFNGTIFLGSHDVLEIASDWSLADTALLQVLDTGPGWLRGGAITQTTGSTIDVTSGATLVFQAPFTMTGGDLANSGKVVFVANNTIGVGANFTMPTSASSIFVESGATVNVDQANFNADGNGTATNFITINAGGVLDLDLGTGGDEGIGGVVRLFGGELDVTTTEATFWALDGPGSVEVGADTGTSQINGERVVVSNPVTVGANATLEVNADWEWVAGGSASIATGALLRHDGNTSFDGGGPITSTGDGTLRIGSTSQVLQDQTISVATFDWDGEGVGSLHTIADGATLTINSANFDDDDDMDDPVTLQGNAGLVRNTSEEWTMRGTLTTQGAAGTEAIIGGQASFVLEALLNVQTDTTIDTKVTFGANATVAIGSGKSLRLTSDEPFPNYNEIRGATINGPGRLVDDAQPIYGIYPNMALFGFGTINADIDFQGAASFLIATDGTLTVNGDILNAEIVGTQGDDAVLVLGQPLDTGNLHHSLDLNGGEVQGALIDNAFNGNIFGHGRITNNIFSSGQISPVGILELAGDLTFDGGFYFGDDNTANQILIEATSHWIGFTALNVLTQFLPTSDATIDPGVVVVIQDSAVVFGGATFTGGGALRVASSGFLNLVGAGTDVDVHVVNGGDITLSGLELPASPTVKSFEQEATGSLTLVVDPLGMSDDVLAVTGLAELGGELQWSLPTAASALPGANEVFTIMMAGSISGAFANAPDGSRLPDAFFGAGSFEVNYTATSVQLLNFLARIPGDFDFDGDVDGRDFLAWQRGESPNPFSPGDLTAWQANYGVGPLVSASVSVPEPGSFALGLLWASCCMASREMRKPYGSQAV